MEDKWEDRKTGSFKIDYSRVKFKYDKPNMEFEFESDDGMLKARYEDLSKIIIGEIKEWRKEQSKIQEILKKEKKKEQNKPILVEKPIKSEKSQPILITKFNKFEEKPPANPPEIVKTA
jgi:hypothetical protein